MSTLQLGRRVLKIGGQRILECRCDKSTLMLQLHPDERVSYCATHNLKSFCQLCGVTAAKTK